MSKQVVLILLAFTSLFFGFLTYLVLDRNILLFSYFKFSQLNLEFRFFRNYFSDFFYVLFVCLLSHLYFTIKISNIYIVIFLFTPILHELFQFFFLFSGTFDIFDMLIYLLVISLYYSFIFRKYEQKL